jgi:hypothetical protein
MSDFPLWPASVSFNMAGQPFLRHALRTGPVSLSGLSIRQSVTGGRWLQSIDAHIRPGNVLDFRAFLMRCEGGATPFWFTPCDPWRARWDDPDYPAGLPYADGAFHSDGSGFAVEWATSAPALETVETALTDIAVDDSAMKSGFVEGQMITVEGHLHGVEYVTGPRGAQVVTVKPRLRRRLYEGGVIDARPRWLMRFVTPEQGRADIGNGGRIGTVRFDLEEAWEAVP